MTIIVRKNQYIATDSLQYHGGPMGVRLSYSPKLHVNTLKTCVIAVVGINLHGTVNVIIDKTANQVYLGHQSGEISEMDFDPAFKALFEVNDNLTLVFATKYGTTVLEPSKEASRGFRIFNLLAHETVYVGSGHESLDFIDLTEMTAMDMVDWSINHTSTVGGDINYVDLTTLNDIAGDAQ